MLTFAEQVYEITKQIPKGQVTTYKLIAEALNKPKSCQAVGQALAVNPYAPIVPCHRVIASNGSIGGFFGSFENKKKIDLLKSEGIKINGNILDDSLGYRSRVIYKPIPLKN